MVNGRIGREEAYIYRGGTKEGDDEWMNEINGTTKLSALLLRDPWTHFYVVPSIY
jgi:hypothetical protein